jgi:hypothetical protein
MSFRAVAGNFVHLIGGEDCIMNKISPRTSFEMTIFTNQKRHTYRYAFKFLFKKEGLFA